VRFRRPSMKTLKKPVKRSMIKNAARPLRSR
jgi:hypothetical protein